MKALKILMLLENNPFPQDSRVRHEAYTLHEAGFDLSVICPMRKGQPRYEQVDGIRVYRYPAPPSANGVIGYLWEYGYSLIACFLLSLGVLFRHGFHVIHAHNPPDIMVFIALFYKLLGKKFVFDHHDLSPEMYDARFGGKSSRRLSQVLMALEKLSCRSADAVIATNQSYKRVEMERDGVSEDRITIVRNAPDLRGWDSGIPELSLRQPDKLTFGYVGVMGYQDGIDYLLRALDCLRHEFKRDDFFCLLIGDGDAAEDLRALCTRLKLESNVRFLGWATHQEVISYVLAADICVAPEPSNTYNDRSSMIKLTEYMAAAKPIVAFDLPEHRFTAEGAALFAKPNEPGDFAAKLLVLMDSSELRSSLGCAGRQRIETSLAWKYQAENLVNLYRKFAS